jgi:hypothetical protein
MSDAKLSATQTQTLDAVLDELIPPSADGRLPGAGEIHLGAAVEKALLQNPGMAPVIHQGLTLADAIARAHGLEGFGAASGTDRAAMMKELEAQDAGFVMTLMFIAYAAYYKDGAVLEGLGLEPRPPHPQGYSMEPHDLTLLDAVRRRGRMFR